MGYRVATRALDSPIGKLRLAAAEAGLVRIAFPSGSGSSFAGWLRREFGAFEDSVAAEDRAVVDEASRQLEAYFEGRLTRFSVPLSLRGTDFQRSVWRALGEIPYGGTWSYADLAARVGRPTAFRAVGAANGANPIPIIVPCHRVIERSGRLGGFGGGLETKRRLLALERTGSLL